MRLDATSFGSAVQRLRERLARHEREPADEQLRDGLIQISTWRSMPVDA